MYRQTINISRFLTLVTCYFILSCPYPEFQYGLQAQRNMYFQIILSEVISVLLRSRRTKGEKLENDTSFIDSSDLT